MDPAMQATIESYQLKGALAGADESVTVVLGQQAVLFVMPKDLLAGKLANKRAQEEHALAGQNVPWVCVDTSLPHPMSHPKLLTGFHYKITLQPETAGQSSVTFHSEVTKLKVLARFLTHNGREVYDPSLEEGCAETLASIWEDTGPENTGLDAMLLDSFLILAYKWAADVAMTFLEVGPSM